MNCIKFKVDFKRSQWFALVSKRKYSTQHDHHKKRSYKWAFMMSIIRVSKGSSWKVMSHHRARLGEMDPSHIDFYIPD